MASNNTTIILPSNEAIGETKLNSPIYGSLVPLTYMVVGQAIFTAFIQVVTLVAALLKLKYAPAHRTKFNFALILNAIGALPLTLTFLWDSVYQYSFAALSIHIYVQAFFFYILLSRKTTTEFPVMFTVIWTMVWFTIAYLIIVLPFPIGNIFGLVSQTPISWFYGILVIYTYLRQDFNEISSSGEEGGEPASNSKTISNRVRSLWMLLVTGAVLFIIQGTATAIWPNTVISVSLVILIYGYVFGLSMMYVIVQDPKAHTVKLGYGSWTHVFLMALLALIFSSLSYVPSYFINGGFGNVKLY